MDEFWNKVDEGEADECWEWKGNIHQYGYGRILVDGTLKLAHRVSYRINKSDPGEMCVLHKCDNPPCVNPNHLFLGTREDNNKDAARKGRTVNHSGESNPNVELTDKDVQEIRQLPDNIPNREIAQRYGVSTSTIGCIIRRETWKDT